MKTSIIKYLLLALCFASAGCSFSIPSRPDKLGLEPVTFSYEAPLRWELDNGLTVLYLYDGELPQMQGTLYVRGGSLYEDPAKTGVASATGSQMRAGGTRKLSPNDLDRYLDSLGASVVSAFDDEFGSISFYSLTSDFPEVFSVFSDVIQKPRFEQSRFALWKGLAAESIARRKDNPNVMAGMAFKMLVYGQESPYAKSATTRSIQSITSADLRKFHAQFVRPNGSMLAVTGNLPADEFKSLVQKKFANWAPNNQELPAVPEVTAPIKPGIYLLNRDFQQATLLVGHRGPTRLSPDMYKMKVFNTEFGYNSFSSVLFEEIRTKRGLAYSAYGGFQGDTKTGQLQIYVGTRIAQVPLAWKEVIRLAGEARTDLPEQSYFENAKNSIEKSYVFRFSDADSIVTRAAMLELLGYSDDFNETYLDNIRAVTRQDVMDFAAKEINPSNFVTVIVGKLSVDELRSQLGDGVEIHEISFDEVPSLVP